VLKYLNKDAAIFELVEKGRPMLSQSFLFPIRIFVLAIFATVMFVPEASAFRILKVASSSADKKAPVVRYIYPGSFKQDEPLDFSVREPARPPVIIKRVSSCNSPRINLNVDLYRRPAWYWNRNGGIRIHRAAVFPRSGPRLHRAAVFGY